MQNNQWDNHRNRLLTKRPINDYSNNSMTRCPANAILTLSLGDSVIHEFVNGSDISHSHHSEAVANLKTAHYAGYSWTRFL
jgi:hypothetical protein